MIADIGALLEIELEKTVHQGFLRLRTRAARPPDGPVCVQCVGRNFNGVERKVDARAAAGLGDALVGDLQLVAAPELGFHVFAPVMAFRRNCRIELVWPPGNGNVEVVQLSQRCLEIALADVAPGADDIRNDVDVNVSFAGHGSRPSFSVQRVAPFAHHAGYCAPNIGVFSGWDDPVPVGDALFIQVKQRHDVVARDEHPVQRAYRGVNSSGSRARSNAEIMVSIAGSATPA